MTRPSSYYSDPGLQCHPPILAPIWTSAHQSIQSQLGWLASWRTRARLSRIRDVHQQRTCSDDDIDDDRRECSRGSTAPSTAVLAASPSSILKLLSDPLSSTSELYRIQPASEQDIESAMDQLKKLTSHKLWKALHVNLKDYKDATEPPESKEDAQDEEPTDPLELMTVRLSSLATAIDNIRKQAPDTLQNISPSLVQDGVDDASSVRSQARIKLHLDDVFGLNNVSPSRLRVNNTRALSRLLVELRLPYSPSALQEREKQRGQSMYEAADLAEDSQLESHLARQFDCEYQGDSGFRFLRFSISIRIPYNGTEGRELYHFGSAIVQSCGTGNTRMVLKLAKYAPLLFICMRPEGSTAYSGFPPSDGLVVSYLASAAQTHRSCNLQVAAFLGAWFEKLADLLQACSGGPEQKAKCFSTCIVTVHFTTSPHRKTQPCNVATPFSLMLRKTSRMPLMSAPKLRVEATTGARFHLVPTDQAVSKSERSLQEMED